MSVKYDPVLYDLAMSACARDDVAWYTSKAREIGGPIVELGAGSGRITVPLAADGFSVHAVESDPRMLNRLREKLDAQPADVSARVVAVDGDMRAFNLGRRFALAIIPFRAFLENKTTHDQLACLRCVHDHLEAGGTLALDVFHPSLEYMAQHSGALRGVVRWSASYPLPDGDEIVRWESIQYDAVRQLAHTQHRYEHYSATGSLVSTQLHQITMAYLYPGDIRLLLEQAGFERIRIAGAFNGRPLEADGDELVVEATRP
jgi:Methyltransferase domain